MQFRKDKISKCSISLVTRDKSLNTWHHKGKFE